MKTKSQKTFVLGSVFSALFVILAVVLSDFSFAGAASLGDKISLDNVAADHYYIVFNPDDIKQNGGFCASIAGAELLETGNGLEQYGTCFVNDKGVFEVLEVSDNL